MATASLEVVEIDGGDRVRVTLKVGEAEQREELPIPLAPLATEILQVFNPQVDTLRGDVVELGVLAGKALTLEITP